MQKKRLLNLKTWQEKKRTIKNETQREKKFCEKQKKTISELCYIFKYPNTTSGDCSICKWCWGECSRKIAEAIMDECILNLMKTIDLQIQEVQ